MTLIIALIYILKYFAG